MKSLTGSTQPVLGLSVRRINHRVTPPDFAAVGCTRRKPAALNSEVVPT